MCELDVFALCIEIVTFVATIIVLVFALVPIFRDGDRKKLKEQLDKSNSLTRDLTSMKNQLIFLLLKTNNIDNMDDEFINQIKDIDDSRIQNNCGIYYLKKSRSVSENKNHLLQTALKHLTKALDLSKGKEEIKREIIYVNLADAYDDLDQKDKAYRCCKSARKVNEE